MKNTANKFFGTVIDKQLNEGSATFNFAVDIFETSFVINYFDYPADCAEINIGDTVVVTTEPTPDIRVINIEDESNDA